MHDLVFSPITELSRSLDTGSGDAETLTRTFLDRINGGCAALNCFITLCEDSALDAARAAAMRAASGERRGLLDGIPVAVKDNIDVAGVPTSNGFGGPPWRIPDEDAEVVRRLRASGAVILGKLNMHEGAMGATNDNPHHGRAINPHRPDHSPGGSSGGSGAAVAGGLCCMALGTDTGGSVRIPASYCGIVGLKPSFGLISTRGVVPLSHRLDHVGPLTRTVADAAALLGVLAGYDATCAESRRMPARRYDDPRPARLDGVRLGVIDNFDAESVDADVIETFARALDHLRRLGATIVPLSLPTYDPIRGRRACFVRVEAEAAFHHGALYAREPERFSPAIRGYLDYGLRLSAQRLLTADRRMDIGAGELNACFDTVDAIVSPATPQAAPAFDTPPPENAGTFSVLANFAGCPAISLPMGVNTLGLPLGLQFIGPAGDDRRVLGIAAAHEAASQN